MITGFNSEVAYNGMVFHVQTEDRGRKAARIDTIIYKSGGAVVYKKQIFYRDILDSDNLEQAIREIMEETHERTIGEIKRGLWTLGKDAVPKRSFRSIVGRYLNEPESATGLSGSEDHRR